jgi:hypothetical protein
MIQLMNVNSNRLEVKGISVVTQDRPSVLELVDAQYKNVTHGSVKKIILNFSSGALISSACGRIFSLVDREDDYQRQIARKAWLIKSTVLQTMLEFDDSRLGLIEMAEAFKNSVTTIPAIASAAEVLVAAMRALVAAPNNPKRDWFLSELKADIQVGLPIGIFAGLQGAATPGWPAALSFPEGFTDGQVVLVRNRKDLKGRIFEKLVIPGSLKFAVRPLVQEIFYGGRSSNLILLTYAAEKIDIPQPILLPVNSFFEMPRLRVHPISALVPDAPVEQMDQWAYDSIWSGLRALNVDLTPTSEGDVLTPARFVLFADGSGVFLPDSKSVTEISDLFDENRNSVISEERMPRKNVRDLEESDLVMLRLSGSGDYLDDVANVLMQKEGHGQLRLEATEWKPLLHRTLKKYGEGVVAKAGRNRGLKLRSATYLWAWAGDDVIAPHDFNTFLLLIETIAQLDTAAFPNNINEYAHKKWQQMEQLKSFHARAGATIRTELVKRVNILIKERRHVETIEIIELPDVASGQLGLLRVAAVDTKPVRVPQSKLFQVFPLKER